MKFLMITAARKLAPFPPKTKIVIEYDNFYALQPSEEIIDSIVNSDDAIIEYEKWVKSQYRVDNEPIYAYNDVLGVDDPIGYQQINHAEVHLIRFSNWLNSLTDEHEISFTNENVGVS